MPNSIFEQPAFEPYRAAWAMRCMRYDRNRQYYNGIAYEALRWRDTRIYEGTRTLFSPLRRVVRVDVAKVPAAWALPKEASDTTVKRVRELRRLASAELEYQRFLKRGAVAGEAAMMLSGEAGAPVISALRPDEVILGTLPDGVPFALIVKRKASAGLGYLGQLYAAAACVDEYAQVITPDRVTTYHDGKPLGQPLPNAFGFIPVVFSAYVEGEDGSGESAFAGVLNLLDRVNEVASITLDAIERNAEPLVVGTGVTEVNRDEQNDAILIGNPDAKLYTLDPKLAIAETLEFIRDVRGEFKTLLPQLTIDALAARNDLAYETVVTLLQELGDHIVAVRSSVDLAVETIERWMFGQSGGVPDDYELDRDRSWLSLTESQQLDLELKRMEIESKKKALTAPPPAAPTVPAPGAPGQEAPPNATGANTAAGPGA